MERTVRPCAVVGPYCSWRWWRCRTSTYCWCWWRYSNKSEKKLKPNAYKKNWVTKSANSGIFRVHFTIELDLIGLIRAKQTHIKELRGQIRPMCQFLFLICYCSRSSSAAAHNSHHRLCVVVSPRCNDGTTIHFLKPRHGPARHHSGNTPHKSPKGCCTKGQQAHQGTLPKARRPSRPPSENPMKTCGFQLPANKSALPHVSYYFTDTVMR